MRIRPHRCAVLFILIGLATHSASAQSLSLYKNYFVTGDYLVAGWQWDTTFTTVGTVQYANGTINIPDTHQPLQAGVPNTVPDGATIVAAFLYWQDVEKSGNPPYVGQTAFFNGYSVTGTQLGNNQGPSSWSSGGCAGANTGSKTLRSYRADVRPYLLNGHVQNGQVQFNGSYTAMFADSGKNQLPYVLGASLVIVYRVLSPAVPLNSVVIYDGAFYPNNSQLVMTQQMQGFYQAASPAAVAKLTHIVGNGQSNKGQMIYLQGSSGSNVNLPSLYSDPTDAFPGVYMSSNGTWDNPTWLVNKYGGAMQPNDSLATASVIPNASNAGCVTWGASILSTTVQDTDGDSLLDKWESQQGYTDVNTGQFVALPGANPNVKDIFVEVDYLKNLDGSAGPYLHSHLPKQQALDKVGNAFANAPVPVHIHFDVGNVYQGDPYVVPYNAGQYGGNAIAETEALCIDSATRLCAFPGTNTQHQNNAALTWKGGFLSIKDNATDPVTGAPLGNFQVGRKDSYHYVLFGHALGAPRSIWTTTAAAVLPATTPASKVLSIVNSGTAATVTIQSPATGTIKPGDCPNAGILGCSDANSDRVTIGGARGQTALNGTYHFTNASSTTSNNITTTTFSIVTAGVPSETYNFNNEPQLVLAYLGPTSISGRSDIGGGDTGETFGLWAADNVPNCNADPSLGAPYCDDQVGTVQAQAGTLMHELGHTLTLTHGGTYYNNPQNYPSGPPIHGLNCKPDFLSVMSYLFQIRGFPDGGAIDYSRQTFAPLNETMLNEGLGIGTDLFTNQQALHYTRLYAPPNAASGSPATRHCDGSPIMDGSQMVRVDGNTYSSPMDWNNDLVVPDAVNPQDVNFNGTTGDSPLLGFNDWSNNQQVGTLYTIGTDLRQIGARQSAGGSSGDISLDNGDISLDNGDISLDNGDISLDNGDITLDNGDISINNGEQDFDTANSTVDAPTLNPPIWNKSLKAVQLSWSYGFGQIRTAYIFRMTGSFTAPDPSQATLVATLYASCTSSGACTYPTSYNDTSVKNNATYTYYLVDQITPDPGSSAGRKSGPSNLQTVTTQ